MELPNTYDTALEELRHIKTQLEEGSVGIDDLVTLLARAKKLIAYCKTKLQDVETAIDNLI